MQEFSTKIDHLTISYLCEGIDNSRKMPVVFVHGNSQSSRCFQKQLESALSDMYRLYALDLPGHGKSSKGLDPRSDYSLRGYAKIVTAFAETVDAQDAVFVGWSLGGHILIEAATELCETKGMMIVGTPPLGIPPRMADAFTSHPASQLLSKTELTPGEIETFLSSLFSPEPETALPKESGAQNLERLKQFREDISAADAKIREALGVVISEGNYRDELKVVEKLVKPLAVIHGKEDQLVRRDYFETVTFNNLWKNRIIEIEYAGHTPHWEQPEQFNAILKDFLTDLH
jgi:pimeloyl-ACP methyl ester carboxylesterase